MTSSDFIALVTQLNGPIISNLNTQAAQLLQGSGSSPSSQSPPASGGGGTPGAASPAPAASPPAQAAPGGWGGGKTDTGKGWGVTY